MAFSLTYDKADGGPRGIGAEHLRETLLQIARPILRAQAAIAYGGNLDPIKPPGANFTLDLLNLIREEQQERSSGTTTVKGLYNFQAWPYYLKVDRAKEAEWITCCQLVRITQRMAGFPDSLPDKSDEEPPVQRFIRTAVCLSAMRRCMAEGCQQEIDGVPASPSSVPEISARIVMGGKMEGFSGIMPGIFEEVLTAREASTTTPIFILGGFGGAAGALANALRSGQVENDPRFTAGFYSKAPENSEKPGFTDLLIHWNDSPSPPAARSPQEAFDALRPMLQAAAAAPASFLNNGLDADENRRLLTTVNPTEAVRLVLRGLSKAM